MNKAEEFASAYRDALDMRPASLMRHGVEVARVSEQGKAWIGGITYSADDVLALANWILETFKEEGNP